MAAFGGSSVVMQIQSSLNKSLSQRCREIEDIIRITSTKELRHALPYIVESIFGFGSESGWGIDRIEKYRHLQDFESVRRFLAPDSPLLDLIYKLQADPYLSYEFPLKYLPAPTRHLIEEGMLPSFLANKIHSQGYGQTFLSLGAFEYFVFHLAYCLVNPNNQRHCPQWTNLYDFVYPNVIDDYISYFLPLDKKMLPPMPNIPSPVRSPVSHFTVPSSYSSHSPTSPSTTPPRHRSRPSLFRTAFTAQQKQHVQGSPVLDQSETETWRSETLLQVFAEFWLKQNPGDSDRAGFPQAAFSPSSRFYQYSPSVGRDPFAYLFESYMPSLNQVKIVRLLVKYLHYFTNSASNTRTSQYHTIIHTPLDEFKRTAVPQIIQRKLYTFLRHAFDRWPLDSSFRMVLETWLSYIQPWRYIDPHQHLLSKSNRLDPAEVREKRVDDKWEGFVEENLLFYTVLFQQFLPRVFRLDLASPQSAYMLYRVSKVFCLPNLAELIFRAESWSNRSARLTQDLGASYLSSEMSHLLPSLPPHLVDLEAPGYLYTPMFGERMNSQIQDLMEQLVCARDSVINQQLTSKPPRRGVLAWLLSVFTDPYPHDINDTRKLQLHINQSLKNLSEIFKIRLPEDLQDMSLPQDQSGQNSLLAEPTTPDCIETNHGPVLTELGKYQMMNKLRKFDSLQSGDPDLQPIRSYENAALVRVLYQFCDFVNTQFASRIDNLYSRQDLIGRMMQVYLAPPLRPNQQITSPTSRAAAHSLRQPRLSLRFLASYQTLLYLAALFVFFRLWLGAGPIEYVIILALLTILYGFFKAVIKPQQAEFT